MLIPFLLLLAATAAPARPFEISSNKPFVPVTIDGSAPQWFILDTGNGGGSVVARECADRLQLGRGAEQQANIGAGSGAVSIDGRRTPMLTLDEARERFRSPVTRSLEVRRGDQTLQVRLAARRLV